MRSLQVKFWSAVVLFSLLASGSVAAQDVSPQAVSPAQAQVSQPAPPPSQDASTDPAQQDAPSASRRTKPDKVADTPAEEAAQTTGGALHDAMTLVRRFPRDQFDIYTFPAHVPHSRKAIGYIAPFAIGAAFIAVDSKIWRNLPAGNGGVSKTIANVGLDGTGVASGLFYLYGLVKHDEHARETGLLAGESLLNSLLPHAAMSMALGRRRPFQGAGEEIGEGDFLARHSASASMPSGHAMFTWAMATTIADEYPSWPNKILWYGVGTTVAISRVTGREHFPSDVIIGSAIGYMIATHIYHRHHHVVSR